MVSRKQLSRRVIGIALLFSISVLMEKVLFGWEVPAKADSTHSSEEAGLGSDLPLHDTVKVLRQLAAGIDSNLDSDEKKTSPIPFQYGSGGMATTYFITLKSRMYVHKIMVTSMSETSKLKEEYYFTYGDQQLFLVLERLDQYLWPFYMGHDPRIRESVLNEFYISDGKVIDWIQTTTHSIRDTASVYQIESKRLLDELDNYKKLLSD